VVSSTTTPISASSTAGTISPGSQITLLLTITTTGSNAAPYVSGTQYTISIYLPGYTTSIKLVAQ
jgi:hypothetical protein